MYLFATPRLALRRFRADDLEAFHEMQCNAEVMRYIKPTMTLAESRQELQRFIAMYTTAGPTIGLWAADHRELNELVGMAGIYANDGGEYEVAYRLRQKYWGQGMASELAPAVIRYGFDHLNLPRLVGCAHEENVASVRILDQHMRFLEAYPSNIRPGLERKYELTA